MIPTFIGTTLLVFVILQLVPGNPFEKAKLELMSSQMHGAGAETASGITDNTESSALSKEVIDQLKKQYGVDKPIMVRYLIWLGVYPRLTDDKYINLKEPYETADIEFVKRYLVTNPGNTKFKKGQYITSSEKEKFEEKISF